MRPDSTGRVSATITVILSTILPPPRWASWSISIVHWSKARACTRTLNVSPFNAYHAITKLRREQRRFPSDAADTVRASNHTPCRGPHGPQTTSGWSSFVFHGCIRNRVHVVHLPEGGWWFPGTSHEKTSYRSNLPDHPILEVDLRQKTTMKPICRHEPPCRRCAAYICLPWAQTDSTLHIPAWSKRHAHAPNPRGDALDATTKPRPKSTCNDTCIYNCSNRKMAGIPYVGDARSSTMWSVPQENGIVLDSMNTSILSLSHQAADFRGRVGWVWLIPPIRHIVLGKVCVLQRLESAPSVSETQRNASPCSIRTVKSLVGFTLRSPFFHTKSEKPEHWNGSPCSI